MAIHKVNGVLVRVATFSNGSNQKHGNFLIEHLELSRARLDKAASVTVKPSIPGNSFKLRRGFPFTTIDSAPKFDKPVRLLKVAKVNGMARVSK